MLWKLSVVSTKLEGRSCSVQVVHLVFRFIY